jgi:hypothetical protein
MMRPLWREDGSVIYSFGRYRTLPAVSLSGPSISPQDETMCGAALAKLVIPASSVLVTADRFLVSETGDAHDKRAHAFRCISTEAEAYGLAFPHVRYEHQLYSLLPGIELL